MSVISPALAVRNVKETIEFYEDYLGFKMGLVFPDAGNPQYADLSKDGMVNFMVISQKMDRDTAEIAAKEHMAEMPAWSNQ